MKPKVSVIMCAYKEPVSWLEQAIASILKQTYKNFELIVVVDNPNNQQHKEFLNKIKKKDKRIHLIYNPQNVGGGLSLHKGIQIAKGDYIAIADGDDISLPNRLELQIEYLQKNPNVDVIGSSFYMINTYGEIMSEVKWICGSEKIHKHLRYYNCMANPSAIFRKSLYQKTSGYRNIRVVFDYDLWLRFLQEGAVFDNIPKSLVCYRMNEYGLSNSNLFLNRRLAYIFSKNYHYFLKHGKEKYSLEEIQEIVKESDYVLDGKVYQFAEKIYLYHTKLPLYLSSIYKALSIIFVALFSKYHRQAILFMLHNKIAHLFLLKK